MRASCIKVTQQQILSMRRTTADKRALSVHHECSAVQLSNLYWLELDDAAPVLVASLLYFNAVGNSICDDQPGMGVYSYNHNYFDLDIVTLILDLDLDLLKVYLHTENFVCRPRVQGIQKFSNKSLSHSCLLYTSPSPRDGLLSRMPSSA